MPWRLRQARRAARRGEWLRALLIDLASMFANYRSILSGPRVRIKSMRAGGVGVALSVVYSFFDEADVLDGTPKADYIGSVLRQIEIVNTHVRDELPPGVARVATNPAALREAIDGGQLAVVHCVEGGFHLGGSGQQVREAVAALAEAGVAYITLAHLIYREIATDAPALPFLSEKSYHEWFRQPADVGLWSSARSPCGRWSNGGC